MRLFKCDCGHPVFLENTLCLSCGAATGYDPAARTMVSLEAAPDGSLKRKGSEAESVRLEILRKSRCVRLQLARARGFLEHACARRALPPAPYLR